MLCYVIDDAFPSPVSSGSHRTKAGRSTPKLRSPKLNLTNFLIKLLIRLGRKYYFHFTCQKRGLFVRSVAIYWGLKIGPKLLSSLVSFFTVSWLLVTGDTPTVTAVCGFCLADRISPDAY